MALSSSGLAQAGSADAQGVAIRFVFPNYQFPLHSKINYSDLSGSGLEFEYLRKLSPFLDLALPMRISGAEFPTNASGGTQSGFFLSADVQLQMKYFPATVGFNPWMYAGAGLALEDLSRVRPAFPVGFGLDMRIYNSLFLSSRIEYRFGGEGMREHILGGIGIKIIPAAEHKTRGWTMPMGPRKNINDRDGDGVKDADDRCPDQAGLPALGGCPDRDGDGLPDHEDACPDIAGVVQGCPDADGDGIPDKDDLCPLEVGTVERNGCPVRDKDGDGIEDPQDDCPEEPGGLATRGCPDRDGDGIADKDDLCPDAPGPATTKGCPDSDSDGIADKDDRCPNTPGLPALNGCPEVQQEDRDVLAMAMRQVQFETGSDRLRYASFEVLDQVVNVMRKYPDFSLAIIGHTDNQGNAEANMRLSLNRAQVCYDYLIARGIGPSRLSFQGMGATQPLTSNNTPEGRAMNRRVEFLLSVKSP